LPRVLGGEEKKEGGSEVFKKDNPAKSTRVGKSKKNGVRALNYRSRRAREITTANPRPSAGRQRGNIKKTKGGKGETQQAGTCNETFTNV